MTSGYTPCACRDCFDISMDNMLCHACKAAGCDSAGAAECERSDAYGADDLCEHGNWVCSIEGCPMNDKGAS